jgi:hypothetical protein
MTIAREISTSHLRDPVLAEVAAALAQTGRVEEAIAIAREVADDDYRVTALKEITAAITRGQRFVTSRTGLSGGGPSSTVRPTADDAVTRLHGAVAPYLRRVLPDLRLRSVQYSSPGWIVAVGALHPLRILSEFIAKYRTENTTRQHQEYAFQLELLDRMPPELRDQYAPALLRMIAGIGDQVRDPGRVGHIAVNEEDG